MIVGLAACAAGDDPSSVCSRLDTGLARCHEGELPTALRRDTRRFCTISMQYQREPGDAPGNLAEKTRATLLECSKISTCPELHACLDRGGCRYVSASGDPADLQFSCW